jgi:hydroxymethylglutaryl-CoA synthase
MHPLLQQNKEMAMASRFLADSIGIDDFSVYVPKLYLPTTGEFASSRGIEPAKLIKGIGIERMAIPDAHEDAATMAAMSLWELMQRNRLQPQDIGKIYIGTESGVDEAKAIGTYVIGMLEKIYGQGSFQECLTVEFKSACIAASYALEDLCSWVAAGRDEDRIGVAVASDIARYPLRSGGEYTQGAGSVSLLVKKNPRLIALEDGVGVFTRDENDFFRPLGCSMAVVNGKHSNDCYLDAVGGAFASFAEKAKTRGKIEVCEGECVSDHISHFMFHIPYPRMVEYASAAVFRQDWRGLARWKEVEEELGKEPSAEDFSDRREYEAAEVGFAKKFSRSNLFLKAFDSKVRESARISRQVGNIYTGSMYLGLASLAEQNLLQAGQRVCFGSYGSGCSALVFSGIVQDEASSLPARDIFRRLDERKAISLREYEDLHEGRRKESLFFPEKEFALLRIDEQGYRHYEYVT